MKPEAKKMNETFNERYTKNPIDVMITTCRKEIRRINVENFIILQKLLDLKACIGNFML